MPGIKPDQFETQVFPLLSVLALRNDLKEQYLLGDYSNFKDFDPAVLAACQPVVDQNQASFLGVYGTMVKLQTKYSDPLYDFPDCPTGDTITKVVGFLKLTTPPLASKKPAAGA